MLLLLGLVSTAYGIGQHLLGLFPWETDWVRQVAIKNSAAGWVTVGLRGVEFRTFSLFFNYMDFFFANVLIFALLLASGELLDGRWRKMRIAYFVLWAVMLFLSLERMPMMMTVLALVAVYYLKSSVRRRKVVLLLTALSIFLAVLLLKFAAPLLENTGASKLTRFGEMSNPLAAYSLADRAENFWKPALETVKENPLGVGIGYGSQSRATEMASETAYYVKPHNELIQKALETGIMGAIIYVLLLGAVFKGFVKLVRAGSMARCIGSGMAAASAAFWVCGMVNLPFSGSSGLIYWACAGVSLAIAADSESSATVENKTESHAEEVTSDSEIQ